MGGDGKEGGGRGARDRREGGRGLCRNALCIGGGGGGGETTDGFSWGLAPPIPTFLHL